MSKVVKTLFGGTDTSAQDAQVKANAAAQQFIAQQAQAARGDVLRLFPQAQQNLAQGTQAALDVLGQTVPQQFSTFQQGNVGAQQALLAGLPQIQNAILGQPVNLSGLQPQTIEFDAGFAQQQLPGSLAVEAPPQVTPQPVETPRFGGFPGGFPGSGAMRTIGRSDGSIQNLLSGRRRPILF